MIKHHILSEHTSKKLTHEELSFHRLRPRLFKNERAQDYFVFKIKSSEEYLRLKADYYVGIDWLVEGKHVIHVEPKINTKVVAYFNKQLTLEGGRKNEIEQENKKAKQAIWNSADNDNVVELNYLEMLLEVLANPITAKNVSNLILIDWEQTQIPINQRQDKLTPLLIIQYLQLLKAIVQKGLKKSYYKEQENLRSRIKGKILVGQHIKQNVFKNKFTSTFCEFQVFGEDNVENRFLKKVFQFATAYVENNRDLFNGISKKIEHIISYCRPAFEQIGDESMASKSKAIKQNPIFREYQEAIKIGEHILKKFSYNISKTGQQEVSTPPFWIDMPALFELYFYAKLLKANPENLRDIHFQFSTYGNALDFLISAANHQMIIDTKYKLQYKWGKVHQDIRQVSGYGRLNKVRHLLHKDRDQKMEVIDCLIAYPETDTANEDFSFEAIAHRRQAINSYYKVYKLGIKLPLIE